MFRTRGMLSLELFLTNSIGSMDRQHT